MVTGSTCNKALGLEKLNEVRNCALNEKPENMEYETKHEIDG